MGLARCMMVLAVATLAAFPGSRDTQARTWYVEKDGSGDFTVIQAAVEAAATGDTIRIGPGRWTDYFWYQGWVFYVHVIGKDLTFIGAGASVTIVGHDQHSFPHPTSATAFSIDASSPISITRFEDIGVDMPGLFSWAIANGGSRLEVQNCRFTRLDKGVFTVGAGGGFIRNCEFEDVSFNNGGTAAQAYTPARDFVVEHSVFINCTTAFRADWSGCRDVTIQHCTITGGRVGVGFFSGASGNVRHCTITGPDTRGISLDIQSGIGEVVGNEVLVTSSYFASALYIGNASSSGTIIVRDNIFESNQAAFSLLSPRASLDCRGNHFLQHGGQGWLAWAGPNYSGDPVHLDLTGNWWGTTDTAYIAEHIWDGHDDPQVRIFFDYEPIADGPIPTEGQTWSQVKERFRD
jgi:hypothetical protein